MRIATAVPVLVSVAGLFFAAAVHAGSAEMKILDLSTNPPPTDYIKPFNLDAVAKDDRIYFTDWIISFANSGQWQAGGAGYNKEVSAVLYARLVGVDDDKLQEAVDEAYQYAQQKFGETFQVVPDDEVLKEISGNEKIMSAPPTFTQAQLRVETPSEHAKGFTLKTFVPFNKPRQAVNSANMGVGMAWYKAQLKLKATASTFRNQIEFARVSSSVGASGDGTSGKTARVGIEPYLSMVGGGNGFFNTKMKAGMLQPKEYAGFPDTSWVKEVRKNDQGVHEIVVDPELHKQAVLKLLKAHIDAQVALVKAERK